MEMTFWLPQDEAALAYVDGLARFLTPLACSFSAPCSIRQRTRRQRPQRCCDVGTERDVCERRSTPRRRAGDGLLCGVRAGPRPPAASRPGVVPDAQGPVPPGRRL